MEKTNTNKKDPQKKNRLGTVSKKITGGLKLVSRYQTHPYKSHQNSLAGVEVPEQSWSCFKFYQNYALNIPPWKVKCHLLDIILSN